MKVLFVDRDGTLIEEPPDEQVDSLAKLRFLPGVFAALREMRPPDGGWRSSPTRTASARPASRRRTSTSRSAS